tara:strand:+ start:3639 stop:4025 length:387 start_codon:yes stop_codon:yes gene_type:complete
MQSDNLKYEISKLDKKLSSRHIDLDPKGYFIIKIDKIKKQIIVEHYLNNINNLGIAIDPVTNKPIQCDSKNKRKYNQIFSGKSAKEVGILISENNVNCISKFDHALYLGRELQKAQNCLFNDSDYIQD